MDFRLVYVVKNEGVIYLSSVLKARQISLEA